jgi:hypothetical protein
VALRKGVIAVCSPHLSMTPTRQGQLGPASRWRPYWLSTADGGRSARRMAYGSRSGVRRLQRSGSLPRTNQPSWPRSLRKLRLRTKALPPDLPDPAAVMGDRAEEEAVLVEALVLLRDHPQWAIWLPVNGRDWTAIRPASSRPPAPELPTIWVQAGTSRELTRLMQAADEQVSGRGWPNHESR